MCFCAIKHHSTTQWALEKGVQIRLWWGASVTNIQMISPSLKTINKTHAPLANGTTESDPLRDLLVWVFKKACASLMFRPPLSETSVGVASGDGSVSTLWDLWHTCPLTSVLERSGYTVTACIILWNLAKAVRERSGCNSSHWLKLGLDTSALRNMDTVRTGRWEVDVGKWSDLDPD